MATKSKVTTLQFGERWRIIIDGDELLVQDRAASGATSWTTRDTFQEGSGLDYAAIGVAEEFTAAKGSEQVTATSASGVLTLDFSLGNLFTVELFEDITSVVISNTGVAGTRQLIVKQDSTGSWTMGGWDSAVIWVGGSAPTITTTLTTGRDVLSFLVSGDSTPEILGVYSQDFS